MSRIPESVVDEVGHRSGYCCEMCGRPAPVYQLHHRMARGMGGSTGRDLDVAVNLLLLHPGCHAYAHGHVPEARAAGWIVPSWGSVEDTPVVPKRGLRV